MDSRHRQLLGSKDHLQLRQQVKAYLPVFFPVITIFNTYLQVPTIFIRYKNVEFLLKMLIVNH